MFLLACYIEICFVLDVAVLQIEELKAEVSNKEYEIITECAISNFSEVPDIPPPLNQWSSMTLNDTTGGIVPEVTNGVDSGTTNVEPSLLLKLCVSINLVELSLYTGLTRDSSLATVQVLTEYMCAYSSLRLCYVKQSRKEKNCKANRL